MIVNVPVEIDDLHILYMLCDAYKIDKDLIFSPKELLFNHGKVYMHDSKTNKYEVVDDRPDLIAAVRNLVNITVPGIVSVNDEYITHYKER